MNKVDTANDTCVFVLGCDRSGTTLLQNLLNAHPDIFMTYELGLIYPFEDRYKQLGPEATVQLARSRGLLKGLDEFDENAILQYGGEHSFAQLMAEMFRQQAKRQNKKIWGDKRPQYTEQITRLAVLFPNARFVNVVRDPRAVALSWAKTDWGPMTAYYAAKAWKKRVQNAKFDLEQLDKSRSITVHFEDLVNQPKIVLTQICEFIGVEFTLTMLDPTQRETTKLTKRLERLHPNRSKPIMKNTAEAWRGTSRIVLSHIESVCHEEMKELGYVPITRFDTKVSFMWKVVYRLLESWRLRVRKHK